MTACTRNFRDGNLTIRDGTGSPNTLDIPIEHGDLAFTVDRPVSTVKNRGKLDHRRAGDEMETPVSFTLLFTQYSYASGASTGVSPADALLKQGGASAWITTHDACSPYAVDLVFDITDPTDTSKKETLVFPKFHADSVQFKEGDPNTLSVSGKSFATGPTRTYA